MHVFLRQFGWISLKKTKKCLKRQEYGAKLKISNVNDEGLADTIKMDI
jgi:hypothetical protein